jgi:hypothetical protein
MPETESLQRYERDYDPIDREWGMFPCATGAWVRYRDVEQFARELLVELKLMRTQVEDLAKVINWRNV